MSSKIFFIAFFVAIVAAPALATEYVVGDDNGWKLNFDYQKWPEGKQFIVGDKLSIILQFYFSFHLFFFPFQFCLCY